MGIRYKKEDIDKLLFTELVFGMRQDDGNVFRDEIFRRLRFCGLDDYAMDKRGNWKPYSDEFFKYYN